MRDLNARWFQKLVDESIDFSEELRVPEIRFHGTWKYERRIIC